MSMSNNLDLNALYIEVFRTIEKRFLTGSCFESVIRAELVTKILLGELDYCNLGEILMYIQMRKLHYAGQSLIKPIINAIASV
jgi:hypothetical protein